MKEKFHFPTIPTLPPPGPPVPDIAAPAERGWIQPSAAGGAQRTEKKDRKQKKEKEKAKELRTSRGVETLFRSSYQMHVQLAALADSKANMLISINGVIISVALAVIGPRVTVEPLLLLPTALVVLTCLAAISFAVLAARPRVSRAKGAPENLMFFGDFLTMSESEYEAAVAELIRQPEALYRSLTRDIYALGRVLDRKFRLLRVAYTVFMVGLGAGVLLFLAVYLALALNVSTPTLAG